jgi:hypothetical protein
MVFILKRGKEVPRRSKRKEGKNERRKVEKYKSRKVQRTKEKKELNYVKLTSF